MIKLHNLVRKQESCIEQKVFVFVVIPGGWDTSQFGLNGYEPLNRVWFLGFRVLNRVYNFTIQSLQHGINFGGAFNTNNLFTEILLDDISFTKRTKRIMVMGKGLLSLY